MKNQFSGVVNYIDHKGIAIIKLISEDQNYDESIKIPIERLPLNTLDGDYLKFIITHDYDLMRTLEKEDQVGGYVKKEPVKKFRENT